MARTAGGRTTSKGGRTTARGGRYTPPTPREVRRSPKWMGPLVGAILLVGVLMIILNYFDVLPASPTNWYLLGGIIIFAGGFGLATQWR